jgi:hypothetical protein
MWRSCMSSTQWNALSWKGIQSLASVPASYVQQARPQPHSQAVTPSSFLCLLLLLLVDSNHHYGRCSTY